MASSRKRFDLNSCTVDQLEFIDGMTRPLAKRIVAYRNRAGYFETISDLGKVRGIGDHMLSLISKHAYVLRSSPRRSRRSSLASSRASSPGRERSRRSISRVSFSSSRHPSPIRNKSPKREVARPTRRSERILSRSSLSWRSTRSSPSLRGSPDRYRSTSPKRKTSLKQNRSTKMNSTTAFRSGPVYVDSAQNVSIDLGKLAKEGCNLTLHGSASEGQSCQILTVNVKELDGPGPSLGLSIPSPGRAIVEQQQSSSPERPTRASSVVDENVREYLVIRDTKRSRSRSRSPKKASLRRSRSGSRQHSPPRSRRRHESPANGRLSRSDIENWLQEGSAPPRVARGGMNVPLASSTPRRRRDKRERRSLSPTIRQDIAGPSRIENDRRNEPVVLNRLSPKEDRHSAVQDGRRSRKQDGQTGRWKEKRGSRSPRRKLDLDDDDGNAQGRRRRLETESIDQGMETLNRNRGRPRDRRASNRRDEEDEDGEDDEQVRGRRRREPRHRSKTSRDSHRRRRHEEADSYGITSWCSVA